MFKYNLQLLQNQTKSLSHLKNEEIKKLKKEIEKLEKMKES